MFVVYLVRSTETTSRYEINCGLTIGHLATGLIKARLAVGLGWVKGWRETRHPRWRVMDTEVNSQSKALKIILLAYFYVLSRHFHIMKDDQ